MQPPFLMTLALLVLAPYIPDLPAQPPVPPQPPVLLSVEAPEQARADGFDAAEASDQVMEGIAARLRSGGLAVRPLASGGFLVAPDRSARSPVSETAIPPGNVPEDAVTLSIGFNSDANRRAGGTETHFSSEGEAAWRLASQLQRHMLSGLKEVLGYDSLDRGIWEQRAADQKEVSEEAGPRAGVYPLFVTNPEERQLLDWPETLDVIAAAVAYSVAGYMDPSLPTPPRDPRARSLEGWEPVAPRVIRRAERDPRIALTFDGGSSAAPTPAILKALRDAGIRATMFMTANFVERNPDLVVQMARDGHRFGNHTATHPNLTELSRESITSQLDRVERAVRALTGQSTRPWFRPPFGAYDDRVVQVAAEQGYYTVLWTTDSADWRPELPDSTVKWRIINYSSPGSILIQHLGSPQSARLLPETLKLLQERGLRFGTLPEVLNIP